MKFKVNKKLKKHKKLNLVKNKKLQRINLEFKVNLLLMKKLLNYWIKVQEVEKKGGEEDRY